MLSESRFKQMHTNLSGLAQKVYAAAPISEPWSASRIHAEMQRNGGSTKDLSVVSGCLNNLISSGLIAEPERGIFMRSPVKEKPSAHAIKYTEDLLKPKEPMTTPVKTIQSPVVILSRIATKFKALLDELETAALEIEESNAVMEADAAKLKQLQNLLKNLG